MWHFDLYRLKDPEELELMGIRDYFAGRSIRVVEWPEQGQGILPDPDLVVSILYDDNGRLLTLTGMNSRGSETEAAFMAQLRSGADS